MKTIAGITALTGLIALLMACGTGERRSGAPSTPSAPDTGPTAPRSSPVDAQSAAATDVDPRTETRIQVTIGDERFEMTLDGSPAARDLIDQLPVTLQMDDHGAVEKTGPLPRPLSLDGQPPGADPEVADVGYYAPGNDLVFYYGDQSYYPGIVVLGRMDQRTAERISGMRGSITATVTLLSS